MRRFAFACLFAFVAALAPGDAGASASQGQQVDVSQLGPEPTPAVPRSLDTVVKGVPAAIVAEILEPGTLKLEFFEVPHSTKRSVQGLVTYHVAIRDVLFNRVPSAPRLVAGATMEIAQRVGRESAEAFLAKQSPVAPGDECLLFLSHGHFGWELLGWHLQFRKSKEVQGVAEGIGKMSAAKSMESTWRESVPFASTHDGPMPYWDRLVDEVRRLAK